MIQRPLPDPVKQHLGRISDDGMDVFLAAGGCLRGVIVHGTQMVHQARSNHGLSPIETTVLGRALMVGALQCGNLKGKDRAVFTLQGDGPVGGLAVEMNVLGELRGYLQQRITEKDIPPELTRGSPKDGARYRQALMQVSDRMLGSGTLSLTRFPEGAREPFHSTVAFPNEGIDTIFEQFYLQSEQNPTRIWTSFAWDDTLFLQGAAALMLQALPDTERSSREEFLPVEQHLDTLRPQEGLARVFADGMPTSEVIHKLLAHFDIEIVGTRGVEFFCSCNKERFGIFLQGLPYADREEIRREGPFPLTTICHYCGSRYEFSRTELDELLGHPPADSAETGTADEPSSDATGSEQ